MSDAYATVNSVSISEIPYSRHGDPLCAEGFSQFPSRRVASCRVTLRSGDRDEQRELPWCDGPERTGKKESVGDLLGSVQQV
jgi:hypothetical protein